MLKFFSSKKNALIFSVLSGIAYFITVIQVILNISSEKSILIAFFFFPAIICGSAIIIFKAIKNFVENEFVGKLKAIVFAHIIVMLISLLFIAEWVLL